MADIKTIDDENFAGKKVLVRVDFNAPVDADGNVTMRETLDLGLTIDERLADGYYYSKSIRLLKYLLEHPEELEKPLKEEVSYE